MRTYLKAVAGAALAAGVILALGGAAEAAPLACTPGAGAAHQSTLATPVDCRFILHCHRRCWWRRGHRHCRRFCHYCG